MSGWWPWGRSRQTAPESAPAVAATDPGWRALAPIQRAIGPMTPTASLSGFVGSLTVAHDPGLVPPPPELATEHADRITVLPLDSDAAVQRASNQPPPAATQQSTRTWAPRLGIQRAALSAAPQPDVVSAPVGSLESPVAAQEFSGSLVEAPDPAEQRPVPVVSELPGGIPSPESGAGGDVDAAEAVSNSDTVSSGPVLPTPSVPLGSAERPLPIQRVADTGEPRARIDTGPTPESVSVPSARTEPEVAPAVAAAEPRLPIQRAADAGDSRGSDDAACTPTGLAAAFEPDPLEAEDIPVTPVVPAVSATSDRPVPPEAQVSAVAPLGPVPGPSAMAAAPVQRAPEAAMSGPAQAGPPERTVGPRPAVQRWPETDKPVGGTVRAAPPTPPAVPASSPPPPPVQSSPPNAAEADATDASERPPIVLAQRMPSAEPFVGWARERLPRPAPATVQRLPGPDDLNLPELPVEAIRPALGDAGTTAPALAGPIAAGPPAPQPSVQRSSIADVTRTGTSGSRTTEPAPPSTVSATPTADVPLPPTAVQRSAMPVVAPIAPDPPPWQRDMAGPMTSGVPSAAASPPVEARLVVLPPVRGTASHPAAADATPTVARTVIAESSQPVSLQRMFEHTARTAAAPAPATDTSGAENADPGMCTVTFNSPVVQREASDAAPPAAQEQPAGGAAAPAAAQAGGGAPATTNIQELVNQIYDPLAARIRAELWLDRERAGVLMDLRR